MYSTKDNQQHAYIVGNHIRLDTEAEKSTKESYAQVFILQIHWDKRTKALEHQRKLKDDQKWYTPEQLEIALRHQQSQQRIYQLIGQQT
jgi:hypothetical protein